MKYILITLLFTSTAMAQTPGPTPRDGYYERLRRNNEIARPVPRVTNRQRVNDVLRERAELLSLENAYRRSEMYGNPGAQKWRQRFESIRRDSPYTR